MPLLATCAHIIVVREIDIKHQLPLHWCEGGYTVVAKRIMFVFKNIEEGAIQAGKAAAVSLQQTQNG